MFNSIKQIDSCDLLLWVLDSGKISGEYVCPAQLLAFNLLTDELEFKKKIPPNAAEDKYGNGLLYNLIVSTDGRLCNNTNVSDPLCNTKTTEIEKCLYIPN